MTKKKLDHRVLNGLNGESLLHKAITVKNLRFSIEMDDKLPTSLETDIQRLNQILKNLLSNAFKFTHRGRVCLFEAETPAAAARLGPGLPVLPANFSVGELQAALAAAPVAGA